MTELFQHQIVEMKKQTEFLLLFLLSKEIMMLTLDVKALTDTLLFPPNPGMNFLPTSIAIPQLSRISNCIVTSIFSSLYLLQISTSAFKLCSFNFTSSMSQALQA